MAAIADAVGPRRSAPWLPILALLIVSLALLVLNFIWIGVKSRQESQYVALTNDIQVESYRIATFAAEAASGNTNAFGELSTTRTEIENRIATLEQGDAGDLPASPDEVAEPLAALRATWNQISASAQTIETGRGGIIELADAADQFALGISDLQARTDELVRLLTEIRAPHSQLYFASGQLTLAESMLRRVGNVLQGGTTAMDQARKFATDAATFGQVLFALRSGNEDIGVQALRNPEARAALEPIFDAYNEVGGSVDVIVNATEELRLVKQAADEILLNSKQLLLDAEKLEQAYVGLAEQRFLPSAGAALLLGVAATALLAILTALLWRQQREQLFSTSELNRRNQEAILRLLDEMGSLAEGDLTVRATVTEDITGAIADSINFAVEALRTLVTTINETALQVASAAQETQATAMHLAEASEHQAQQITSASAAVNEIAVSIDEVSRNSSESADVAKRSVSIATKGADVVRQTIEGMDNIRGQIQETSKRIKRLGESSQEIGDIVELITDIAEQTNILALNAAISAASAGEAGRGFAVVADEVQRLAERASNATKRIETLVQTIQADTNEAVISMEQTTTQVVSGAKLAEDAGEALGEIESVSNDLADLIQNISEAARQQSAAATNISGTMNVIQEITTQTSAGTSQTAESIGVLANLASDLRKSVADFKLPAGQ